LCLTNEQKDRGLLVPNVKYKELTKAGIVWSTYGELLKSQNRVSN